MFLCSAPLAGQPNAGLTGQGLRLACAEPGDQLAIFGEALRELSERATYLYEEAGRYWFSTQPTLNRLAEGSRRALPAHEVDAAIAEVLREDAKSKGRFHRVFAVPDDPTAIDEAEAVSLVILGPATPHVGRGAGKSAATDAVTDTLMRCRSAQRTFRNTLLFVAADEAQLATAREAMRRALAWESIGGDPRRSRRVDKRLQDQMTQAQLADARDKAKNSREGATRAVRVAWSHVLFPVESTEPGRPFDLDHLVADRARPRRGARRGLRQGEHQRRRDHQGGSRRGNSGDPARGAVAGGQAASAGGRDRRNGSRPMSICRSCATGWCWRPRSATRSPSSTRNLPMQRASTKGSGKYAGPPLA